MCILRSLRSEPSLTTFDLREWSQFNKTVPFPLFLKEDGEGVKALVEVESDGWWNVLLRGAVLNLLQYFFFFFCWLTVRSWEDGQEGNDTSRGILCCAIFCGTDARLYGLFTHSFARRRHGSNWIQQHMACCSKEPGLHILSCQIIAAVKARACPSFALSPGFFLGSECAFLLYGTCVHSSVAFPGRGPCPQTQFTLIYLLLTKYSKQHGRISSYMCSQSTPTGPKCVTGLYLTGSQKSFILETVLGTWEREKIYFFGFIL